MGGYFFNRGCQFPSAPIARVLLVFTDRMIHYQGKSSHVLIKKKKIREQGKYDAEGETGSGM